ncbi:MAG: 5'-3' exonuclease H3TH domain-containing protein [Pseudomonadota bacterium]
MKTLYLVDGTYELFRCFKATPLHTNAEGREVGAIRGLLQTLVSLLKTDDLSHVAVAFDAMVSRTARSDRSESAMLRSQYPLALDAVRALGMTVWPMVRFQADDAIASAVSRYQSDVDRIVICSSDQDFCQCLNERVTLWNRSRRTVQTARDVIKRYGVFPERFADFLALVGDVSDGLPGIPGFGQKTTAMLLDRYADVEAIIEATEEWAQHVRSGDTLAATLLERQEEAILYRDLSILRTDVPLTADIAKLEWQALAREELLKLTETIEDTAVISRLNRWPRVGAPLS